jgi:hypothetical protein
VGTGVGVWVGGGRGVLVGGGKGVFVGSGKGVLVGVGKGLGFELGVGELQPKRAKPIAASVASTTSLILSIFSSRAFRKIRARP